MKLSTLLAIGSALAWAVLAPVMCRAQTEIAPDHYEMTNVEPLTQPTNAVTSNSGQPSSEGNVSFDQRSTASKTQNRLLGAVVFDSSLVLILVVAGFIETRRLRSVHSAPARKE